MSRHRGAGPLTYAWFAWLALVGEFGPGVQFHVIRRRAAVWVAGRS